MLLVRLLQGLSQASSRSDPGVKLIKLDPDRQEGGPFGRLGSSSLAITSVTTRLPASGWGLYRLLHDGLNPRGTSAQSFN
jgi:hypothetical protein